MILLFPNTRTLQLVLTSGLLPESFAAAPAEFATDEEGRVWVKCSTELEPSEQAALKPLGISFRKSTRGASSDLLPVSCWPQFLPLEKVATSPSSQNGLTERTPVLFELPETASLAEVVSEMLRLGNDRQSFRQQQTPDGVRTLLLVKGPPYYTLLRAIDQLDGSATPKAYVEQHPRVWVEHGYTHPLAEHIQPPNGTFLLLGHPREWTTIEEGKFRDIYEVLRFTIPAKPIRWETAELEERLKVRLRLVRGGSDEPAELWALSETGITQLEDLVRSADDRLISRLAFAVGTSPDNPAQRVLIVKVRPGKEPPPVLVLDGIACRSYLRIPNLFLPVGHRLHPPLRRDAVKQLLAADANLNTWLLPQPDGQFVPQNLPDNAFRPLSDWVDYVLDSNREALTTWMESMRFDFESFICPDEGPDRSPPGKPRKPARDPVESEATPERHSSKKNGPRSTGKPVRGSTQQLVQKSRTAAFLPPSELQLKLQALEQQFREMPEPLDSPARQDLWRELAETHMALGHKSEGAVCHVNGLWEQAAFPPEWIRDWYDAETGGRQPAPMAGEEFQAALTAERPTPSQLNLIAIHAIQAAFGETAFPAQAHEQLGRVQYLLERYESFLPVRIGWLAWLACVKLAHEDLLTLARTRDRVLERLHQQGPSPELDLPGFLRSTGPRAGERFRAVQESMRELRGRVQSWIARELENRSGSGQGQTAAYADLMIAYGYSRVGLLQECHDLVEKTREHLLSSRIANVVHEWLFEAFRYRIQQSLDGKSRTGSLPEELMKTLTDKSLDSLEVYAINSLRAKSRILQPFEELSGYSRYLNTYKSSNINKSSESQSQLAMWDKVSLELEHLSDVEDRVELSERIRTLLEQCGTELSLDTSRQVDPKAFVGSTSQNVPTHLVLLSALLPFAPRLGEVHANELLNEVSPTLDLLQNPCQQAVLLDKALFVAAHFGQGLHVRRYLAQLHSLFETASSSETVGVFGVLLGQSFRGLRKLGMRDEISSLLYHIDQLLETNSFEAPPASLAKRKKAKTKKAAKPQDDKDLVAKMDAMTLRLNLAAGWFYFGNDERAEAVLDDVSHFLYEEKNLGHYHRRKFAQRYASALEHAPQNVALPKLMEIFERLTQITKGWGAGSRDHYYADEVLEIIDAGVLALVSDDMTLDPKARQLMEELEFSIRKRIHRDWELARRQSEV